MPASSAAAIAAVLAVVLQSTQASLVTHALLFLHHAHCHGNALTQVSLRVLFVCICLTAAGTPAQVAGAADKQC